jgi:polyisoprenyl-phosphate glycosyltransferase
MIMADQLPTLQIVCPVYNEQDVISLFHNSLISTLVAIEDRYQWRILYVVDRSSDDTMKILKKFSSYDKNVQIISLSSRFGHQMSLVAGIDHCDSDAVIMMDSDLQHPPELIPELLNAYEQGNDIVYTIRKEPMDDSFLKRFGSNSFYRIISWLSDVSLAPGEADYRLISRRVADVFKNDIRERNQFLRGLFSWVGYSRIGVNYNPASRANGESKYNWSRMFRFASTGIISFSKKPLQYAILLGLLFSFLGLVFGLYIFAIFFISDSVPSGWTTLGVLVSIFSGIQLLFLGIIGEYIGAIFDEVKARPLYLIEERVNIE